MISPDGGTVMFRRPPDILAQRDVSLLAYKSISQALADPQFCGTFENDVAMIVSRNGQLYSLNLQAALMWDELRNPASLDDLVECVMSVFTDGVDGVRADLSRCLDGMERLGLLERI